MGQHFSNGEAIGGRLPPRVLFGQLGHQAAENFRRRLQQVDAGKSVVRHDLILTTFSPPSTTFSAHTASPPPPSRTPAGSRASSRHASIAPRTTSARGQLAWAAPRTRTHRSIPAPPTPAGASRLPRTIPCPTPA